MDTSRQLLLSKLENIPPLLIFVAPVIALRSNFDCSTGYGFFRYLFSFRSALETGILSNCQLWIFEIEIYLIFLYNIVFNYVFRTDLKTNFLERQKNRGIAAPNLVKPIKLMTALLISGILFGMFIPYLGESFGSKKYVYLLMFIWGGITLFAGQLIALLSK